jgi:hypothetical protein
VSITYVGAGAADTDTNASVTPALHASTTTGDVLLLFASIRNSGTGTPDTPAGWTLLVDASNARLFGKYAAASEATPTVTFTGGVANATTIAQVATFRDARLSVLDSATLLNASAQNIAYPALTVDEANCLVVALGWKQDDWTSVTALAGMTEIGEPAATVGDDAGLVWDYQIQTTATNIASGSFVVTGGVAAISRGAVVALRAAPTFTADAQDVYPPRVLLTVTGVGIDDTVALYRQVGGVRTLVRAAETEAATDTSFVRVDAELPFGVPVSYVAVVGDDEYTTSAVTYTLPGGLVVLSDAITGAAAEVRIMAWPERPYTRRSSTFKVGGRNVVVSGDLGMFEGTLELFTETTSAAENLAALIAGATQGIVQVRQPGGYDRVDCYIAVTGLNERRFSQDGTDSRRDWTLDVVEVEGWAPALEATGYTLQDIADAYDGLTLNDLAGDYSSLLAIAQGEYAA